MKRTDRLRWEAAGSACSTATRPAADFGCVRWIALFTSLALSACIVVPRTTESYDADCRVVAKHMELTTVQIGSIENCSNSNCAAALALVGATVAASAVISGSIVVVGNVVYWFEKQGRCVRRS